MLSRRTACVLSQRNGCFNATSKSDDTDNFLADKQLELRMWWNLRNLYYCEWPTSGTLGWLIFTRIFPEFGLKTSAPTLASLVSLYAIYLSTATKVDVCYWGTFLSAPPSRRIWNSSGRCLANPARTLLTSWFRSSYDSELWEYNSENTPCQSQSPKSAPSGSKSLNTGRKHAINVMAFANSLSSSIVTMKNSSGVQCLQIVGNYRSIVQRIQSAMSQWNVHSFDSNEVLLRQRTERLMLQIPSWKYWSQQL